MTDAVTVLKILSNKNRFSILSVLIHAKKDLCVNEIADAVGISQSLTSHQLSYLEAHGVVQSIRMGQMICYVPSKSPLMKKVTRVIRTLQ